MTCLTICLAFVGSVWAGNESVTTDLNALPTPARNFLKKHFSMLGVQQIKMQPQDHEGEYAVVMDGGLVIEFSKRGEWIGIDCKQSAVPGSVVPRISQHIQKQHPDQYAVHMRRSGSDYLVRLLNGSNLRFSSRGSFLQME